MRLQGNGSSSSLTVVEGTNRTSAVLDRAKYVEILVPRAEASIKTAFVEHQLQSFDCDALRAQVNALSALREHFVVAIHNMIWMLLVLCCTTRRM